MTRHLFLVDPEGRPPVVPSQRWVQAFPQGLGLTWDEMFTSLKAGDVLWLSVSHWGWIGKMKEVLTKQPKVHVVVLSMNLLEEEGLQAIGEGAKGYCHGLSVPALFQEVAEVVSHEGYWLGPDLVRRLAIATQKMFQTMAVSETQQKSKLETLSLSDRERQVAQEVVRGKSNKEIADTLHISERTVKAHLGAAFEKLGVRDRLQLVLMLQQNPVS